MLPASKALPYARGRINHRCINSFVFFFFSKMFVGLMPLFMNIFFLLQYIHSYNHSLVTFAVTLLHNQLFCVSGVVLALKVPQLAVRRQNLMSAVESLTTIASLHQTQPTIQGCRVDVSPTDVSPTESSWMLRPLDKASLGYCTPDRCVPTLDRVTHRRHNAWTAQIMGVASAKLGKLVNHNFAPRGSQHMDRIKNARPSASTVLT
jgi:hypothetical protein